MLDSQTFTVFKDLIYEKSGINLKEGKESLLEARIGKRMREIGLSSPKDYFEFLSRDQDGCELVSFLDAISTNVTQFFREPQHFQILEQVLKRWASKGQTKFRIWSAASSSGQEPYSIAMTVANTLNMANYDVKILGTDISTKVLSKAKLGIYDKKEFGDLPRHYQLAYTHSALEPNYFEVDQKIRSLVTFSRINLSTPPFPMKGPFDFVFCRNVMIYFDSVVRNKLVADIHRLLKPGGILFIGHSETLTECPVRYTTIKPSVYRKEGDEDGS
ncbi:MAG: hypothetical protein A2X86_00720 [Bdellovibrionales bacterium GWA2_49_15]|nr:MAG: hypothetical protein A2X86_00720 [Bdellovibrionales bacterium GWA2_49_15]HAZ14616.1 chemotaxis protein CheR [Bdellovibrionales bacterium]